MEVLIDQLDRDLLQNKLIIVKTSKYNTSPYVKLGKVYLHSLVMERVLKRELKKDERVDHINGNGLDNRRENLRVCSHQQNMANQSNRKNTSSKYKGVTFNVRRGDWQAKISPNYSTIHLGYFDNEEEAAKTYDEAAVNFFGEFARLNFI